MKGIALAFACLNQKRFIAALVTSGMTHNTASVVVVCTIDPSSRVVLRGSYSVIMLPITLHTTVDQLQTYHCNYLHVNHCHMRIATF